MECNDALITNIEDAKSLEDLSSCLGDRVEGLQVKIHSNICAIFSEAGVNLADFKVDMLERLKLLDRLGIDIPAFLAFFESQRYWDLEYTSTADHISHTEQSLPSPLHYAARQHLDYVLFPTYYLRRSSLLAEISKYLNTDDPFTFFDAGLGSGEITSAILRNFPNSHAIGVDVLEANLRFAKEVLASREELNRSNMYLADLQTNLQGLVDEKVDLIVCSEVLEHVEHPEGTLANLSGILEDNGIAVITVPLNDPGHEHLQNFTHEGFLEIASRYFQIEEAKVVNWNGHLINAAPQSDGEAEDQDPVKHLLLVMRKYGEM